jgi:hypothetical protein
MALSAIFVALSVDEIASFHERSIDSLRAALGANGLLYYPWVLIGGACALAVLLIYLPFLRRLPARTRILFLIAGSIYVIGALGMEMIGGWHASKHGVDNLTFATLAHIEEGLELAGMLLFLYALLDYLRAKAPAITLHFEPAATLAAEIQLKQPVRDPLAVPEQRTRPPVHLPSTSS